MPQRRNRRSLRQFAFVVVFGLIAMACGAASAAPWQDDPVGFRAGELDLLVESTQAKMVKIYGAGGLRGLEAFQTGMLISEQGHILTAWSYVLDASQVTVHMFDGLKYQAQLIGIEPTLEIAVLKIDAGDRLPHFQLRDRLDADAGTSIWAFSNLYGVATGNEPVSVQQGVISVVTNLDARRGTFDTPYQGRVYVLDAVTNNPGAAGGALVDRYGTLLGMLGKEMKNSTNNTWLNYAIPVSELNDTVTTIIEDPNYQPRQGAQGGIGPKSEHPMTLERLGIVLVPEIVSASTPPFVDDIRFGSPAEAAGIRRDDLLLFLNGSLIHNCRMLKQELEFIDETDTITISVLRSIGGGQEIIDVTLSPMQVLPPMLTLPPQQ